MTSETALAKKVGKIEGRIADLQYLLMWADALGKPFHFQKEGRQLFKLGARLRKLLERQAQKMQKVGKCEFCPSEGDLYMTVTPKLIYLCPRHYGMRWDGWIVKKV